MDGKYNKTCLKKDYSEIGCNRLPCDVRWFWNWGPEISKVVG